MKLNHVALVASSQDNADRFYEGILKLKKVKASYLTKDLAVQIFGIELECPFVQYGNDQIMFEIFITDSIRLPSAPVHHVCIEVADREAFIAACRSTGAEVRLIPRGDWRLFFVRDLDGNLFEIK